MSESRKFRTLQVISKELREDIDPAELDRMMRQLSEDSLTREGARRVSEWKFRQEEETPWGFSSRIAYYEGLIGERYPDEDDLWTAEDVERIRASGPEWYHIGECLAVELV